MPESRAKEAASAGAQAVLAYMMRSHGKPPSLAQLETLFEACYSKGYADRIAGDNPGEVLVSLIPALADIQCSECHYTGAPYLVCANCRNVFGEKPRSDARWKELAKGVYQGIPAEPDAGLTWAEATGLDDTDPPGAS